MGGPIYEGAERGCPTWGAAVDHSVPLVQGQHEAGVNKASAPLDSGVAQYSPPGAVA